MARNPENRNTEDDTQIQLSELQLALMRCLWDAGEASASDVQRALESEGRRLALTTVATLLNRLEKRGVVGFRREGRQLIYRATVSENLVRRSMVSGLLGSLFGGDPKALVSHLVKESELSDGDLERVRDLLEDAKGEKP